MLNLVALKALPWRLLAGAALVIALAFALLRLDAMGEKLKRERAEHAALVDRLKAEAARQKQVTSSNVSKAREGMKQVEPIAKRIETAPLPGNCQTPREILGADL